MDEIPKFWQAVRRAVQDVYRVGVYTPDTPLLTRDDVRTQLAGHRSRWFRLESTAGYDESALPFLTDPERNQLRNAVERFRAVAPAEPDDADTAKLGEATDALADICAVLDFYRYRDWPALVFGKQIERRMGSKRADIVTDYRFFTYRPTDDGGHLYVFALLSKSAAEKAGGFLKCTRELREQLSEVASEIVPEGWYILVRFRYDAFPVTPDPAFEPAEEDDGDDELATDVSEADEAVA